VAFWAGEFCNSFALARLKILTKGRRLWVRTLGSTVVGQAVDTAIFATLGFAGTLPAGVIKDIFVFGFLFKVGYEALMRDDWLLVPDVFRIARRTMRTVKLNLAFTAVYNIVGLALAAFGILPPIVAAAAQSLPDLGILANSSRLLRQR